MTLSAQTIAAADEYWAADIGCAAEEIGSPGVAVAPPADPAWRGIFVFARGGRVHITVPDDLRGLVERAAPGQETRALDESWWCSLLGELLLRAIGPAYVGYADETFAPVEAPLARLLAPSDEVALRRFQAQVGPTAWEHSGLEGPQPRAGCWEGGELVAVAGYHRWGKRIAHIGVASDPARRRRGYGKAAVSAVGRHAQGAGLVLQYRTLLANAPSVAIAAALGFEHYATTLALRLR